MRRNTPESTARGKAQEKLRRGRYAAERDRFATEWLTRFPEARKPKGKAVKVWRCLMIGSALSMFGLHLRWHCAVNGLNYEGLLRNEFKDSWAMHGDNFVVLMSVEQRVWSNDLRMRGEAAMAAWLAVNENEKARRLLDKKNRWRAKQRMTAESIAAREKREREIKERRGLSEERLRQRKAAWEVRVKLLADWQAEYGHLFAKEKVSRRQAKRRREELEMAADEPTRALIRRIHAGPVRCYWCDKPLLAGGTVDHVVPLAKGGKHDTSNIAAACGKCNNRKGSTLPQEVELPLGPSLL